MYAYSRFSNAAQAEGDSLRRQLKASIEFAERHDLELDTTLRDHGVSAYTGLNRIKGALGSFIRRVEAGEITRGSYLAVDSMDRFSRESETIVLNMLTTLTLSGIKVVNLAEDHVLDETASTVDYIRVLIHAARSNQESAEKSRKVRLARADERRRAREDLTPSSPVGPRWLRLAEGADGRKVWEPIPNKVAVVQRVFDMKEAGLGDQHIAQRFNTEGVATPTGRGKWFNSTVADMSRSIAAIGLYQPFTGHQKGANRKPDGDPIEGFYPAIIDRDQFHRVQAIRAGRRNPAARPASRTFTNLLVGQVQCEQCGGVVGYLTSTFPKKPHWKPRGVLRCNGVARGLCNNRSRVPYDDLEADLLPFVASLPLGRNAGADDLKESELLALVGQRQELVAKIETLLDQLESGGAVADRLRKREAELVALDAAQAALRAEMEQSRAGTTVDEAQDALQGLRTQMATAEGDALYAIRAQINTLLRQVVGGGFVLADDGKIVVRIHADQAVGRVAALVGASAGARVRTEIVGGRG
ncbi:recombinase family protein [Phenylobacterium sp.]|uniref:recombinase family protein n=1 Tax=Phenylobacterium sp. TaxID=1871053 RepID=UPI00286BB2A3|nr:recombinase family protein [Phenylobacterium sp.]